MKSKDPTWRLPEFFRKGVQCPRVSAPLIVPDPYKECAHRPRRPGALISQSWVSVHHEGSRPRRRSRHKQSPTPDATTVRGSELSIRPAHWRSDAMEMEMEGDLCDGSKNQAEAPPIFPPYTHPQQYRRINQNHMATTGDEKPTFDREVHLRGHYHAARLHAGDLHARLGHLRRARHRAGTVRNPSLVSKQIRYRNDALRRRASAALHAL